MRTGTPHTSLLPIAWEEIFCCYRTQLMLAARSLLPAALPAQPVLDEACTALEGRAAAREFCFQLALRAVVQAALAKTPSAETRGGAGAVYCPLEALPATERAIYFLRDVLGYTVRDVALLVKMGDRETETLLGLARRRLDAGASDPAALLAAVYRGLLPYSCAAAARA